MSTNLLLQPLFIVSIRFSIEIFVLINELQHVSLVQTMPIEYSLFIVDLSPSPVRSMQTGMHSSLPPFGWRSVLMIGNASTVAKWIGLIDVAFFRFADRFEFAEKKTRKKNNSKRSKQQPKHIFHVRRLCRKYRYMYNIPNHFETIPYTARPIQNRRRVLWYIVYCRFIFCCCFFFGYVSYSRLAYVACSFCYALAALGHSTAQCALQSAKIEL